MIDLSKSRVLIVDDTKANVDALIHVLHVTTEEEIALLAQHKDIATVEVTPHHLVMDDSDYKRIGTLAQMNPPVREARHRDARHATAH